MELQFGSDRRAGGSRPLRAGALRCESCGTTWSGRLAQYWYAAACTCRRCGGRLHGERRAADAAGAAVEHAA